MPCAAIAASSWSMRRLYTSRLGTAELIFQPNRIKISLAEDSPFQNPALIFRKLLPLAVSRESVLKTASRLIIALTSPHFWLIRGARESRDLEFRTRKSRKSAKNRLHWPVNFLFSQKVRTCRTLVTETCQLRSVWFPSRETDLSWRETKRTKFLSELRIHYNGVTMFGWCITESHAEPVNGFSKR